MLTDRDFNDSTQFLSISGIESVAEAFRQKYPEDDWYGTYDNVLQVGSYMVEEEQISASDLLYLFEKPYKYYNEFIESHVHWQLDNVVNIGYNFQMPPEIKEELRIAENCFFDWKHGIDPEVRKARKKRRRKIE